MGDVAEWLQPCWVFDTGKSEFACTVGTWAEPDTNCRRTWEDEIVEAFGDISSADDERLWKPPLLTLDVRLVHEDSVMDLWADVFKQHHYLSGKLGCMRSGVAIVQERLSRSLCAFHSSGILPGAKTFVREHRMVVLPSWQGFGIGPKI